MRSRDQIVVAWVRAAAAAVALALLVAGGVARSEADEDDTAPPVSAPPRVAVVNGETVVTFDHATLARSGIEAEALAAQSHQAETAAYGVVLDLAELADARGMIVAAAARVEKARALLVASRAEFERVRALHADERNASDKALEEATARWRGDEADSRGANAALAAQTAAARQRWGAVVSGWLERGSSELEALLAQRLRLVQITLPPGTALQPAPATAIVRGGGGAAVAARLISPAPRTDPRIQGASFYFTVPDAPGLLPGAVVEAFLPAGPAVTGVTVPAAAVVWWQGRAWVYLEVAPGRFVRREVATDAPVAGGWFVAAGVVAGSRVVVRGAQMLLSEEGRAAIQGSEG
ncbi:MAG: efflux RND transporter periplasmic adaptor subunit [Thermoanaerobaculaceae bacterium]|nr:efflux RND transporter periplasmic adaptor subunit [Thermoanaerobaculaceae bacterium]